MTVRNLERAFRPRSIAIFGASARPGSVGSAVTANVIDGGFEGDVWLVNPRHATLGGRPCHRNARALPGIPDLAVIATPPRTVPGIVVELGALGCRAAVVITAGLTAGNGLRQAMLDAARPNLFRIIGPNTLGLMLPRLKLNASFAHMAPKPGNLALLSQSGAIAGSLIDWAAARNVGFSCVASLGDMADVDVADWLDLLAGDGNTRAILVYLEGMANARKFMSAARAAARIKPVIVLKAGRHELAAKAANTHTGALSGSDRAVDAAFARAGILRVDGLADLFDAAEITARFAPVASARVGIVTNGGGAGVLAVDELSARADELAALAPATLKRLDAVLPPTWSRANPVDIVGDASAERYRAAVEIVASDPAVEVVMVFNCPTKLASSADAASAVAGLAEKGTIAGKPVLACWLGEQTARQARAVLASAGVASFETPADTARALTYLADWSKAQSALLRVPASGSEDVSADRTHVLATLRRVAAEGRRMLTEPEAKVVVAAYGVTVPETVVARTPAEAAEAAARLLGKSAAVAVKLLSKAISHKSDVGGVVLGLESAAAAVAAAETIQRRVAEKVPDATIDGYAVQPMIVRRNAQELIAGMSEDAIFGPVILFGAGGTAVEVMADTAVALPPLDDVLAGDLIDRTRIGKLLAGFRDRPPANRPAIVAALNSLAQLVVDFPCIVALDINPLLADADGVIALDARVEIDPNAVDQPGPNPRLAIRPYPAQWARAFSAGGANYTIRPIKPADIALYPDFLAKVSPGDIRLRFLAPRRNFPDDMLKRLTQLDYERDMAFVALDAGGALAGVARLSCDPDRAKAEYALLVRSDLQGHGLGWKLLDQVVAYAKAERIGRIEGIVLSDNTAMLRMCREFGFSAARDPEEPSTMLVALDLAAAAAQPDAGAA
ncbi:MAG: bifunctional acyl-CoA synthetase/GNAT family N-acetyltransferase [Burkholderiaceae bacterium]|nr:MAG: bifunctional acyl-CoA synthetase/GNAT family N-acetyltransferase [Burkholderiaceae bacterium]